MNNPGYFADSIAPTAGSARRRFVMTRTWVRPYDRVLVAALIVSTVLWAATGIPLLPVRPWIWGHLGGIVPYLFVGLVFLSGARLGAQVLRCGGVSPRRARAVFRRHFGTERLACIGRYLVAFCVVMTVQSSIKQAIPFIHGVRYDDRLRDLDRFIHFGIDPAWDLAALNTPGWWAMTLDTGYYLWFPILALVAAYFLTHRSRRKRDHYLAAFLGIWIAGVLVGLAVPSRGPCYVDPERFPDADMPFCAVTQAWLGERYVTLHEIEWSGNGGMTFGCGLMALPSVHVAVCVLYVVFFWNESRWLRWTSVGYALVVFLGSLYSGWHYAVDGYAGAAMALGVTRLTVGLARDRRASAVNVRLARSARAG